jgi:hypothetical protein
MCEKLKTGGTPTPYWWCIGKECNHSTDFEWGSEHTKLKHSCGHKQVMLQLKPWDIRRDTGYPVRFMPMCPVFTDIII